jgi:predicted transposase YbfD/YdcC
MAGAALLDHFSALDDPRQRGKVVYPLPEIMLVVLCATLAGADDLREDAPDIVALDGKTSRRARRGDEHPLHVVSAWASRQRLVLGQQAVGAKSNEIVAISLSLQRLQLTGALVTIDAMGCQTGIARTIIDRSADYLLALKDNQRSLADEAERHCHVNWVRTTLIQERCCRCAQGMRRAHVSSRQTPNASVRATR